MDRSSRRRFLEVVAQGSALAGAARVGVGCSGGATLSGSYDAGPVSAVALGSLQAISSGPLAVGRDAGGLYAMTLICTHAGCDMATRGSVSSSGVVCNCHGSEFDVNGNPVAGPAPSPLQHYEVIVSAASEMTVDADVAVAASARTPPTG